MDLSIPYSAANSDGPSLSRSHSIINVFCVIDCTTCFRFDMVNLNSTSQHIKGTEKMEVQVKSVKGSDLLCFQRIRRIVKVVKKMTVVPTLVRK